MDQIERLNAELAAARDALLAPPLARMQPCGCVVCVCDGHERCHGCGAVACNDPSCVFTSAETRQRIIYDGSPSYAQLRAENERLRGLFSEKRRTEVEWDMVERRLSYYTIPEDDELLAALDQERMAK